ncbi:MAG: hypothetical protein A2V45_06815 [Candidatus Aminicenantes bacterium RBG_19FT_COMBO_58_17]|nr:MAG: hypothetical protein A2V45_06815 [Candidatus Aminicenantes bacterium RBG_19FT_COMBO_58_17]HCS47489.1 hypothetical protein [Candidatus Aminicenantes bacterium]
MPPEPERGHFYPNPSLLYLGRDNFSIEIMSRVCQASVKLGRGKKRGRSYFPKTEKIGPSPFFFFPLRFFFQPNRLL